ncbi:MAG: YraN family protein [Spirochaetia bacterium]|nr:YraN family protein [Spirochaetia bacterium]
MSRINKSLEYKVEYRHEGERVAAQILECEGHVIVCRNFHVRFAEIDLITYRGEMIHFIEVKSYKNSDFVHPLETLTGHKIQKMRLAAKVFLSGYDSFVSGKTTVKISQEIIPDIVALQPSFDLVWVRDSGNFEYFSELF